MADIKFSALPKANQSKDSDEIAILQDGVNKMISSPVLESKIINKTTSRILEEGGLSLNLINPIGVVPTYADLALITPTPEINDAYQVEADGLVYVYTEDGFQNEGDGFKIQPDPIGVVEEGNTQAVSGGTVFQTKLELERQINILKDGFEDLSNTLLVDTYFINATTGAYAQGGTTQAATPDFLNCKGAINVELSMPTGTSPTSLNGIAFYDENQNFITGHVRPLTEEVGRVIKTYVVPEGACFFRTSYFNTENRAIYGEFSCVVRYRIDEAVSEDEILLDEREICDFYSIYAKTDGSKSIGTVYLTSTLGISRYIDCKDAREMQITLPVLTTTPVQGIVFYDENKEIISGILRPRSDANGMQVVTVEVPENANYFRTSYWNYENSKLYGLFSCRIKYPKGYLGLNKKRAYQSGEIYFSVPVNQTVNNYWDNDNENLTPEDYKSTTGVLLLPDNYNPNGKPHPIIMYCHGYSHGVWYDTWGSTNSFLEQKQKWASMGFVVFDCNGARNNNRTVNFTGAGSMQFTTAYKKCFDYIKENYNVEDTICVVGGSAGGPTAINFCYNYGSIVKKLALLSPWTDLYLCSWGQNIRNTFVEYLGFENTTNYEADKTLGYDPALRIDTISGVEKIYQFPVPVKAWIGSLETGSVLYAPLFRFINALRAAGNIAFIREILGLGHSIVSGSIDVVDYEVSEWFKT